MQILRKTILPTLLMLAFSISLFAQIEPADMDGRKNTDDKKVSGENIILDDYTPIEDLLFAPQVADAASYVFATTTSGSLTDMATGTTQLVAANQDDTASALANIGFDFYFQGVRYTQFSVNSNGSVRLGATVTSNTAYNPLGVANAPIITAYGADQRTVITTGKVHFKVTGTAGSRVLIIEFLNMQADFNTGGAANLTYQVRLFETTGVIEFVYGSMTMSTAGAADANSNSPQIGFSSSNTVGTVGSVTAAQSGTPAPTFSGASATPVDNLYVAGPITVLTSAADGARRTFSFTPPVPAAPSGLTFTAVTATSQTLNWTDNAGNEDLFAIYRSTDGTNYTFVGTAAENATSFTDTGLAPSTNYFYRVFAVSEGALSTALSGSNSSGAPGNDTCNGAGGNWSATATWTDGTVPTAGDNVTIGSGCTVTIDVASAALNLTVNSGGTLQYEQTTARTLTVGANVTINSGGTFQSNAAGTVVTHVLSVAGNLTNNGTLDFSTNTDTAGAGITFAAGATDVSFSGTGATTDVRTITVAKGAQARVVELNTTNFTVRGVNTDVAGYLTLTSGTFKISGTFTLANRTFPGPTYTIPALGGFWLNNPNYTVAGTASSTTTGNSGLLRLTQGIYTIGLTGADGFQAGAAGSTYIIEGGTLNANGRFDHQAATTFTMSGGTINVGVVGNTVSNFGTFELFSTANVITISGGNINLAKPSTGATKDDYVLRGATANITGGTVTFGTVTAGTYITPFGTTFTPNVVVNAGSTWNINNVSIFHQGTTLVNDGAITSTGTSARFDFNHPTTTASYSGAGTFGTLAVPFGGVGVSSNSLFTITLNSPIVTTRVNLFTGGFINSGQITLGNGGTSTSVVQIGSTGLTVPGGSFDVSPVHNQGTGGEVILYNQESVTRTTGVEINPTRVLTTLIVNNTNNVTLAGGSLTLNGAAAGLLTLTNGVLFTSNTNLLIHSGTGTNVRTNGYVDGPLQRPFAAAGAYTYFVGQNGYSPVLATISAVTGASSLTVRAVDMTLPGLVTATAVSRYWTLTEAGDLTADLTFTYLDPADVNGTEANYKVFKREAGVTTEVTPNSNNPANNTASVTGVSSFSDWGIGEAIQPMTVPTISDIPNQTILEDANTGAIPFTIGDAETPVGSLTVTGTSSNTALVPNANIVFGGSGASRTVTVTPLANQSGVTTITVTVTDGDGMTATDTFTVTVTGVNDAPTLDPIGNVTIPQNAGAQTVNLTGISAGGGETQVLTVTATSNNTGLIPNPTVTYTSPNATGSISFTPVTGQNGTATITVTVTDDGGTANGGVNTFSRTFTVTVTPPALANVTVSPGGGSYATLKEAFDAINAGTHTGAVIVEINANTTETAVSVLQSSGVGSASYTSVLVRPTVDSVSVSGPTTSGRGLIELNGADNVTIDGDNPNTAGTNRNLTITNTAANTITYTSVLRVATVATSATSADNNTFRNLNLVGSATGRNVAGTTSTTGSENTTFGIYAGGNGGTTAPTAITSVTTVTAPTGTTINNLTISNNTVNAVARGIVFNGASAGVSTGVTVSNNLIGDQGAVTPATPPYTSPATTVYTKGVWAQGATAITISGNSLKNIISYVGTTITSIELVSAITNSTITGNTSTNIANNGTASIVKGILVSSTTGAYTIADNSVTNVQALANSSGTDGIEVASSPTTGVIERNKIQTVYNRNAGTFGAYGLNLTAGNGIVIRNNFVSDINMDMTGGAAFSTQFSVHGIRIAGGTNHKVYHNSVNLFGTLLGTPTTTILTSAFTITANTLTGIDVRNNIFSNTLTGGTTGIAHVSIYLPASLTSAFNLTINNNDYFANTTAGSAGIAHVGTTYTATPAGPTTYAGLYTAANFNPADNANPLNLRTYTSTLGVASNDNASITTDPQFLSSTDLHVAPASPVVNAGASVGVLNDIDGQLRVGIPDIGADEPGGVTPPANDIAATAIVVPAPGSSVPVGATITPQASFTNAGTATQTNVQVQFTITGPGGYSYSNTQTIATIAPNQTVTVTFAAAPAITTAGSYTTSATVLTADANAMNNTVNGTFTAANPVGGTITVGTGGTYASLTNPGGAFDAINGLGATSNITINVTSDLTAETGAIALNQVAGGFTVTIQPSGGAARVISGTNATALITLNGADGVTINGLNTGSNALTIRNEGAGAVIRLFNDASGNTIQNTTIEGGATAATTAAVFLGTGTATGNDNNTITGNVIRDRTAPTVGVSANAVASIGSTGAALLNSGNSVTNNQITNFTSSGILVSTSAAAVSNENWTINGNDISQTANRTTALFGINVGGSLGTNTISQNIIHGLRSSTAGGTFVNTAGIFLLDVRNATVSRNRLYDFPAVTGGTGRIVGIEFEGQSAVPSSVTVVNNMVSIVTTTATVQSVFGIFDFGFPGNTFNGYYNSVYLGGTASGAANSWAIVRGTDPTIHALRNNIAFNNRTGGTGNHFAVGDEAANLGTYSSDYNFFAGTGATTAANFFDYGTSGTGTPVPFATWQAGPPARDANSIAGVASTFNPANFFVNANGGDLHLISDTTPVSNLGTPIAGFTTDFDGQPRSATTPDIGADEFVSLLMNGALQFNPTTYTVNEPAGTVALTVTRTGGTDGAVSATYTLGGGTATGGMACGGSVDYVNTGGTVSFTAGQASQTINVTICNDTLVEGNETFIATLSAPQGGATLGANTTATVTIVSEDVNNFGSFSINDVRVLEGDSGTTNAVFTVTFTPTAPFADGLPPVAVNYTTANGTATAGVDYTATSGTVNFSGVGTQTQTITVSIIGDTVKEANETFFVNLSGATNSTISDNQGVGIIIDEDRAYVADFDGDDQSDLSVFRASTGFWYVFQSTNSLQSSTLFGTDGDIPVPGDYDADGRTDFAVFRPSNGVWYIQQSSNFAFVARQWGLSTDIPVQGDYDGDTKTDLAVFRDGIFYVFRSSDNTGIGTYFGLTGDIPVPGDYDGDHRTDYAVFRPSSGIWYALLSTNNTTSAVQFGQSGDIPVMGDFDGDGKFDQAVYRAGIWYILQSLTNTVRAVAFGVTSDIPTPADYDGDGTTDIGVWRPDGGIWYSINSSNNGFRAAQFGQTGDVPIPSAY